MVIAEDRLYALNTDGFSYLTRRADGRLDGDPVRVLSDQMGWRHFGVTAGGLLIAAADPLPIGGNHDIQIHRLRQSPLPPAIEFQLPTSGEAEAVVIRNGLAYVADGDAGLQVLRFQDADRAGIPPTVTVTASSGVIGIENQRITLTALAEDDVAVASVEFFINDVRVATDEFFPYEHTFVLPSMEGAPDGLRIQARAYDTGGNMGLSSEWLLQLEEDTEGPWVNQTWPNDRSEIDDMDRSVRILTVWLNEAFDPASFHSEMFTIADIGADGRFGTADDIAISHWEVELLPAEGILRFHLPTSLPQGHYGARLALGLTDPRGNPMEWEHMWRFRVVGPWVIAQHPRSFSTWAGGTIKLWFNRPMHPEHLAGALQAFFRRSDGVGGFIDDPIPFTLNLENGGTEAILHFTPPVDPRPDPFNIFTGMQTFIVQVTRDATDLAGSRLKETFSTYWYPAVIHSLANEPLRLEDNRGILRDPPEGIEWRLEIPHPLNIEVQNPGRVRVAFQRMDGSLLAEFTDSVFSLHFPSADSYVLSLTHAPGSIFSINLTLTPRP